MKDIVFFFNGNWTIDDVRKLKAFLFVFGDNDIHSGTGGQAIIRKEPNTIGIPTKKYPASDEGSFYSDVEYKINKLKIDDAFQQLEEKMVDYKGVIFPKAGLGTGLSDLKNKAPKTFLYLQSRIDEFIKKYNE